MPCWVVTGSYLFSSVVIDDGNRKAYSSHPASSSKHQQKYAQENTEKKTEKKKTECNGYKTGNLLITNRKWDSHMCELIISIGRFFFLNTLAVAIAIVFVLSMRFWFQNRDFGWENCKSFVFWYVCILYMYI